MIVQGVNDEALHIATKVASFLRKDIFDNPDLIIVIGGDGTLLKTVNKYGFDKSYIPLNAGHLGFLANEMIGRDLYGIRETIDLINRDEINFSHLPVLNVQIADAVEYAINDVFIERASGQTAHISINVDNVNLVRGMVCDGVIVATPIGSTGYSFSAGGSVLHPLNKSLIITPSNPHHPSFRPIVIPSGVGVYITAEDTEYRPVRIVIDGRSYNVDKINIKLDSEKTFNVGYLHSHNFTKRLVSKILNDKNQLLQRCSNECY